MLAMESAVAELERSKDVRALTLYLRTDRFRGEQPDLEREVDAAVARLIRRLVRRGVDTVELEAEAGAVRERLVGLAAGARGLAVFSSGRGSHFRALPLDAPVVPCAYWGAGFALGPLEQAMARVPRVVVALVRPGRIRFFRVLWGEIEAAGEVCAAVGEDEAGPSLGRASVALRELLRRERADRVLAGGDLRTIAAWREVLPEELRARLERCPWLPPDSSPVRVLEAVLEELWRARRREDERLVDELLRAAEAGRAAVGPDAVAEAVGVGEAGRLVVPEGFHIGGAECAACGLLTPTGGLEHCPVCGAALRLLPDLVERMEERVVTAGGSVDEIGGRPAALLAEHEGIGAFLRLPAITGAGA